MSCEDLDRIRVALEQELAAGEALSDVEIVERVSSSSSSKHHHLHRRHQHRFHPLVVSIGESSRDLFFRLGWR